MHSYYLLSAAYFEVSGSWADAEMLDESRTVNDENTLRLLMRDCCC